MTAGTERKRVVIIGAGISGLTAAYWLFRRGIDVTVIEKRSRVGGTIETQRHDGFLVEMGPNNALETTPLIGALANELGIADQMVYASDAAKNRFIVRGGRLCPVPLSPGGFLRSHLFSARAKMRLLKEPFIPRGRDPEETIAAFVERRLGGEFLDYAINPFVAGVYAGDPNRLSVAAAFPKLYRLEQRYGSVLRGAVAGRKERKKRESGGEISKQAARLFSFKNGLSTLPAAIERTLGERIVLEGEVRSLQPVAGGWSVTFARGGSAQSLAADAVIISTPASAAAELVAPLDPTLAAELDSVIYPPVSMVFLGYEAGSIARTLDGFGFLVPEIERRSILGTIWSSTLFDGRAPDGYAAFTTFIGGSRQPELALQPEEALIESTGRELADFLKIQGGPAYAKVKVWKKAIPQYTTGYSEFLSHLVRFEERLPGLRFCANFKGGISVADCILSADATVSAIQDYFSR